jgi:HEAT repeat protein
MHTALKNLLHSLAHDTDSVAQLPLDYLSDLSIEDHKSLSDIWSSIPAARRTILLKELGDREAIQFDLDFSRVYMLGLEDNDPQIVAISIRNLSDTENYCVLPALLALISHQEEQVRSEAASSLGDYVYLGELGKISSTEANRVISTLLEVFEQDSKDAVRCKALQSLGFSSHQSVPHLILEALRSSNPLFPLAAMRAIGRSADKRWKDHVLEHLNSQHPEMRLEAVRSAGELELKEALKDVIDLLDDVDQQIRLASIWSIAQIGGEGTEEILSLLLEQSSDVEELDLIEDALGLLEFNRGTDNLLMFDLDDEEDPETYSLLD